MKRRITTFLWFDGKAEEAARFYTSIFRNSRITDISRYGEAGPLPAGTVMVVGFELDGQEFIALNGGPQFQFTPAISLLVNCDTQAEVDEYWRKLSAGGEEQPCGWLRDRYGLSWQVVPAALPRMLQDGDRTRANNVMQAMLRMRKIDIARLEEAYARA